ncbi:MAG TPA: DUF6256 family protein [Actinomycetota bacterium]|nr:DUF6256 family protein [Actinomycetota bacterium]
MTAHAEASDIARRIVPPLVTAFVLFCVILRYAVRHPAPARDAPPPPDVPWSAFWRYLALTVLSGYAMLLAIVLVFHVALARDPGAFRSAVVGGGFLAFGVAVPMFVVSEAIERRRR